MEEQEVHTSWTALANSCTERRNRMTDEVTAQLLLADMASKKNWGFFCLFPEVLFFIISPKTVRCTGQHLHVVNLVM